LTKVALHLCIRLNGSYYEGDIAAAELLLSFDSSFTAVD